MSIVPSWSFMAVLIKKSMSVMGDSCTMPFRPNFSENLGGFRIAAIMILPMDQGNWQNMYEDYATIWNLCLSIKQKNNTGWNIPTAAAAAKIIVLACIVSSGRGRATRMKIGHFLKKVKGHRVCSFVLPPFPLDIKTSCFKKGVLALVASVGLCSSRSLGRDMAYR
jgi:hypothetical protein